MSALTGLTCVSMNSSTATFSWDAVEGALFYVVEYPCVSEYDENENPIAGYTTDDTVYGTTYQVDISQLPAGEYYVSVCAVLNDGYTDWADYDFEKSANVISSLSTPAAPTYVNKGTYWVELSWTAIANATGYRIIAGKYSSVREADALFVWDFGAVTQAVCDGLNAQTKYYFRIIALGDGVNYSNSEVGTASYNIYTGRLITTQPTITKRSATGTSITLSITKSGSYATQIAYSYDSGETWTTLAETTGTTYILQGIPSDLQSVQFKARAYNTASRTMTSTAVYCESAWTNVLTVIKPVPLPTPTGLVVTKTEDSITLSWDSVEHADSYQVYIEYVDKGFGGTSNTNSNQYTWSNLSDGETCKVRVCAVGSGDYDTSSYSTPISVTTYTPLYITSTANAGTGTLRQLIADASEGDIIKPDKTLFPTGTLCEITLSSALTINKSLTIKGGQTRIVITSNSRIIHGSTAVSDTPVSSFVWSDVDFRGLTYTDYGAVFIGYIDNVEFNRCSFCGCSSAYATLYLRNYAITLLVADCAFYGNQTTRTQSSSALVAYFAGATPASTTTFRNCTIGGNVGAYASVGNFNRTPGSQTNMVLGTTGWTTEPASSYSYSTWTANSWQSMDPRPSSSATWRTGAVATASVTDIAGNNRNSGGALGAWEYSLATLATPTGLQAVNITSTSARLTWDAIENATNYQLEYRPTGDATWQTTTSN